MHVYELYVWAYEKLNLEKIINVFLTFFAHTHKPYDRHKHTCTP